MDILTEGGRLLLERDYTLIIDKSENMSTSTPETQTNLWSVVKETTIDIAQQCEQFDFDGLTLYLYGDNFERFKCLSKAQMKEILDKTAPSGIAKLSEALQDAISKYFERRFLGLSKPNGETLIVITGSEPVDAEKVQQTIIEASQQMTHDEELGISFIQVGTDAKAGKFLQKLDNDLQSMGAKFDICDTVVLEKMDRSLLAEVLLNAIVD